MSNVPADLHYATTHEWVKLEDDGTVTIGITDFAQQALGDMVFVDLPDVERTMEAEEACSVVESVKAASDVYCPIAGEIIEVNENLIDNPELVNSDPYEAGWLFKLNPENPDDVYNLMTADGYADQVEADEDDE